MPSLFSFLPMLSPGVPFSIINAEIPFEPASLLVKQKKITKSIFIGGGVSEKNAHEIINIAKPDGLDISRSLKGKTTSLSNLKLKKFLSQVAAI